MPDIIVYSSDRCPYCVRAKQLLDRKEVEYQEIRVDQNPAQLQEMMERSRRRTVPQIFINNRPIGGYDELARLDARGELDNLLGQ